MEKELKKRHEEYEELNNSYREVYGSYIVSKTNLDEVTNNYEGEVLKLETMITEKENQYSDLHESFQELLEEKCKLEAELEGYQKAIYEMEENCASLKESHKEELKEIQEEVSNLSSQLEIINEELEFAKERCRELERLNEERASTIDTLNGEIENLKVRRVESDAELDVDLDADSDEEKKHLGIDMEIIKTQQHRIHEEMQQMHKEKEKLGREREEIGREREEVGREREEVGRERDELGREKERLDKYREELLQEKELIQMDRDQLGKEKHRQENNMKSIIIKFSDLQKELDDLASENSTKESCLRESEQKVHALEKESSLCKNKISSLVQKMQELKSELDIERQRSGQLEQDTVNKTGELLKRDSIIQVLYSKLKEKESELVLFQNENLSLKNHKKELSKIWDTRKSEMDTIEIDLYKKLSNLIIKNKIRDRDDLRFDGHPQSFLLKTLWSGYVDICKSILKTRDGYLYSGSRSHRFICAYNTDLFLDVRQDSSKNLLSYRNETRGIFHVNGDEVKSLVYVGPLSKCQGQSVTPCSNRVKLEVTKGRNCNYVFEEMYVTKKGTKIVIIKEKETGKYFSGLHKNLLQQENEKKKTGVDKLEYNSVVSKLINYMTTEEKERSKGDIILRTSKEKVKIESGEEEPMKGVNKTRLVKNERNKSNRGIPPKGETTARGRNKSETKATRKMDVGQKDTKLASPCAVPPKGNYKQVKSEQQMSEENLHRYNIAKEMLLLPGSNGGTDSNGSNGSNGSSDSSDSNGRDDNNRGDLNRDSDGGDSASTADGGRVPLFHLKNEYANDTEEESKCVAKEKPVASPMDGKNSVESFLKHPSGATGNVASLASAADFNDTNVVLTINKEEAILFEVFNYEQIAEHDAVRFASEYVLHFLANWEKAGYCSSTQDASSTTVCSEHSSNAFTSLDGDWCILPAYMSYT
ncbi:hypothetical protein PCYB_093280 [Plasmodium cynomolgi strain B]|uniref:Autophagy-related protein 23 n=1 Tax=Plasmodium cynomolgi (strain B) TaxID=1120755 RepID=K6UK64_PLACD|nr:hypothetical protein PCYB_093280 [Plasmodium cynomolgi strain B]GAB66543.1 hypothetical protein PCYB_093280 [Plasmodium cynomolgi strain B]